MSEPVNLSEYQGNELEVAELKFVDHRYTNADELFSGFDELYAITFSYSLGFINRIMSRFKYAEIILGCDALVKYDLKEVAAFQQKSLEMIKRHSDLIDRVQKKELTFYFAKEILSHEKVFILKSYSGKTRIIMGSANFSARSFSGNQRENIGFFENDSNAYKFYMEEFQLLRDFCTDEVISEALYSGTSTTENDIETIPIFHDAITKEAGVILDNQTQDRDRIEFITDVTTLRDRFAKFNLEPNAQSGVLRLTAKITHSLFKTYKQKEKQDAETKKEYPRLVIDYENNTATLNDIPIYAEKTQEQVRNDISHIVTFFEGYNSFIGAYDLAKREYYKLMNFMFLSPFIAKLRYEAHLTDFSVEFYPYFALIYGPKSAGKTMFVNTVQRIMFGRTLGTLEPSSFTPAQLKCFLQNAASVPLHINDISRQRFTLGSSETIKCDTSLLTSYYSSHPTFFLTTNEIDNIKPEYAKRMYFSSIDISQNNVAAATGRKKVNENLNQISNAFYGEYLSRMIPAVQAMIMKMNTYIATEHDDESWNPDIFSLSSNTIAEIFHDFEISLPDYFAPLTYDDYFLNNTMQRKIRDKIRFEWAHNRKAFHSNRSRNILEYTAGEHGYEATYIRNALPEELQSKTSGTKVIMLLDQAEKFFDLRFNRLTVLKK